MSRQLIEVCTEYELIKWDRLIGFFEAQFVKVVTSNWFQRRRFR